MSKKTAKAKPAIKTKPAVTPTPTSGVNELLRSVGATLLKNLHTTPQTDWSVPITSALQSAFHLGLRGDASVKEEGEDKVLSGEGAQTDIDAQAHDLMMTIGRAMATSGILPDQLKIRCDAVTNGNNEQFFTLSLTIPPAVAKRFVR